MECGLFQWNASGAFQNCAFLIAYQLTISRLKIQMNGDIRNTLLTILKCFKVNDKYHNRC